MNEPNPVLVESLLEIINDEEYAQTMLNCTQDWPCKCKHNKRQLARHLARFIEELNK